MRYLTIFLLTCVVYANSLTGSWHYDDEHNICRNQAIRQLGNIPRFFVDLSCFAPTADKTMYRPMLLVSYACNYAVSGLDTWSWHLVNILIHALNACLVAWLGSRLLPGGLRSGWLAGLLFAVHPLGTEPVNYLSARSDSLMAFFWLLSLVLWMQERYRWVWLTFFLALLTKESAATLPGVLLLHRWMSTKGPESLSKRLRIDDLGLAGVLVLYLNLLVSTGFLGRSLASPARDWWSQAMTQVTALPYYGGLLVFPFQLSVEHPVWATSRVDWYVLACAALVVGWLVLIPYLWRRNRLAVFLAGWAGLALLPVLVMPLNIILNERRLYLPCAAFCLAIVYLAQRYPKLKWYPCAALVILYSCLTVNRNPVWHSEFTLWQDAVAKGPMPRSWLYLGNAWKDRALTEKGPAPWVEAAKCYQKVVDGWPRSQFDYRAVNNLGSIYFTLRDYHRAEDYYLQALQRDSTYADVWVNLGNIAWISASVLPTPERWQPLQEAVRRYHRGLDLDRAQLEAHVNLAQVWQELGDPFRSQWYRDRARKIAPNDPRWKTGEAQPASPP